MKRFARDVSRDWRIGAAYNEGRVDAEGDAIEIITIHSAKGLEWPVVIPINTATLLARTSSSSSDNLATSAVATRPRITR